LLRTPSPGNGPRHRALGFGGGAGNREAGVEEAGAPVSSEGSSMERRRRWVGQKGIEGER
jgi:hypothetical protein